MRQKERIQAPALAFTAQQVSPRLLERMRSWLMKPVQQRRQPDCRCLPKRADQIVTVEVEHLIICHRLECTTLSDSLVRKVSNNKYPWFNFHQNLVKLEPRAAVAVVVVPAQEA